MTAKNFLQIMSIPIVYMSISIICKLLHVDVFFANNCNILQGMSTFNINRVAVWEGLDLYQY